MYFKQSYNHMGTKVTTYLSLFHGTRKEGVIKWGGGTKEMIYPSSYELCMDQQRSAD